MAHLSTLSAPIAVEGLSPAAAALVQTMRESLRQNGPLYPRGGGSKTAIAPPDGAIILDMQPCRGVLEYEPEEFTFTALAGTPATEVVALLAEHGQYLPFDPLLVAQGATLGGTVAANLAGPGRYRYGGVRDFLIGVRFLDGRGNLVRGGGKVVKNAAGFDFPKFLVGSLGHFGLLVELTFKVFPRPASYATLRVALPDMETAVHLLQRLTMSPLEMDALDLTPPGTLWIRIGGLPEAEETRLENLWRFCGAGERLEPDGNFWQAAGALAWAAAAALVVKVPITPKRISRLEAALAPWGVERRYSVGGQVAWIAWNDTPQALSDLLAQQGLSGLAVLGRPLPQPLLGKPPDPVFMKRVKQVFDPDGRFSSD
jgi:glycolate oxidase FAD binding subunit